MKLISEEFKLEIKSEVKKEFNWIRTYCTMTVTFLFSTKELAQFEIPY